jgi:integrase
MATQMLDVGVAVPIVAARLAHARASTTLNVYAHAVPGGDRHAAQQLSRLLAEVMSASPVKLKANSAQSDVGAAR